MTDKPTYKKLEQRVKDLEQARSERALIEETLRKSEEKYSRLFHNSNDGIFIHDLEGNIMDANQKVLELFGYTRDEILSIKIPQLHPAKDLEKSKWAFETIMQDGFVRFEVAFNKKGGELFSAEVSSSLFETGGNKVIQGIVRDITLRKLAAEALQASEEKYKLLAEHSADIIYKLNIETEQYTYISPSIKRVLGYTVEEGLALKPQDTVTSESYKYQRDRLIEAIANHQMAPAILELEAVHKDGHTLPVEIHANFILDEQGSPVEILGVVRGITKRKQAEKALQESERNYQDLYDNAPDMFVSVDANKGTILQCNRTFVEVLGFQKEEVIGRPVFDIYTSDSAEHAKSTIFPLFLETGLIEGEELQVLKKDGSTIDVSLNVSAIRDASGSIVQSRSILRDISKQKQMKEEREKLIQHLQEALKEIKTLRGILPVCSFCKRIRDDQGFWEQVDVYLQRHSLADISHGICPNCAKEHYPDIDIFKD